MGTRPTCYRCVRPRAYCLCDHVIPVRNRHRITVLQHPRERRHPFGTARFVRLGLVEAAVVVPRSGIGDQRAPVALTPATGLLYPAPRSTPLDSTPLPIDGLVVIDGTWAHARTLYRTNPWLAALPHFALPPGPPSRYRLRRQPAPHCLSTIEAVVGALRILEPDTAGLDGLLTAFEHMVAEQEAIVATRERRPRHRAR